MWLTKNNKISNMVFGYFIVSDLTANADPLSKVDIHHPLLEFSINYCRTDRGLSICNQAKYRFYKADYSKITRDLTV